MNPMQYQVAMMSKATKATAKGKSGTQCSGNQNSPGKGSKWGGNRDEGMLQLCLQRTPCKQLSSPQGNTTGSSRIPAIAVDESKDEASWGTCVMAELQYVNSAGKEANEEESVLDDNKKDWKMLGRVETIVPKDGVPGT